jgi:hypothetical protein
MCAQHKRAGFRKFPSNFSMHRARAARVRGFDVITPLSAKKEKKKKVDFSSKTKSSNVRGFLVVKTTVHTRVWQENA